MADEQRLRDLIRAQWSASAWGEPAWVEKAQGGSDGNPDVFLPLRGPEWMGYYPVELKWWEVSPRGGVVKFTARPAQIRFHKLAFESGMRTAFLALLSDDRIVLLPGEAFFRPDRQDHLLEIANCGTRLREALMDEKFWRVK